MSKHDTKKEMIFREFYSLLSSGLDFSRTFAVLIEGESDKNMRAILDKLYRLVVRGNSLWQALASSSMFTALDTGVIRIGEETGKLDETLLFLADYYSKRVAQRRMLWSALSYPLIILFTAVTVVVFMILVIVPMFEGVYARMGGELPAITQGIIALSRNAPVFMVIVAVITIGVVVIWSVYGKRDGFRAAVAYFVLRTPIVGTAVRKNCQAQFCKLLCLLYTSGVPLLRGIEMLRGIIGFYPYNRSFETIAEHLRKGALLADALAVYPDIYDSKLRVLVKVGEETGRLGDMLETEGRELTAELEYQLKQIGSALEPIMIMIIGSLVAVILVAMYMPMFRLGGVVG